MLNLDSQQHIEIIYFLTFLPHYSLTACFSRFSYNSAKGAMT